MIAHVGGVPIEEVLPFVTGVGLLAVRAWVTLRLRRRREPDT